MHTSLGKASLEDYEKASKDVIIYDVIFNPKLSEAARLAGQTAAVTYIASHIIGEDATNSDHLLSMVEGYCTDKRMKGLMRAADDTFSQTMLAVNMLCAQMVKLIQERGMQFAIIEYSDFFDLYTEAMEAAPVGLVISIYEIVELIKKSEEQGQ
jgi:hypothetical protein